MEQKFKRRWNWNDKQKRKKFSLNKGWYSSSPPKWFIRHYNKKDRMKDRTIINTIGQMFINYDFCMYDDCPTEFNYYHHHRASYDWW